MLKTAGPEGARKPNNCKELHGPLAQLVEHRTFDPLVQGSSPWRPTRFRLFALPVVALHAQCRGARGGRTGVDEEVGLAEEEGLRQRELVGRARRAARRSR